MNQKVWVINDESWNRPSAKARPDDPLSAGNLTERETVAVSAPKKSPAVSFSLSMLAWGSGHLYIGEYGPGAFFLGAMLLFYSALSALVVFRDSAGRLAAGIAPGETGVIAGVVVFLLVGLAFWLVNAVDAYFRTTRLRTEPFSGVANEYCSLFCSVLFPGWGQFLNGQPRKGIIFLLFGATGVFTLFVVSAAHCLWPVLKSSPLRFVFDFYFAAALLFVPLTLLMWVVAAYDAFRFCRESGWRRQRMKNTGYGGRKRGAASSPFPRATAILGLLLAISVGMQSIPRKFYLSSLETVRGELLTANMEIVPELIGKTIDLIGGGKS